MSGNRNVLHRADAENKIVSGNINVLHRADAENKIDDTCNTCTML
jgi:hypothetical protein